VQSVASAWLFSRTRAVYREEFKRLLRFAQETHAARLSAARSH
jgi:hypothetical protein